MTQSPTQRASSEPAASDVCRMCGELYSEHLDSRPVGAPAPRNGCGSLKAYFSKRAQAAPPITRGKQVTTSTEALAALDHLQMAGEGTGCCADARNTLSRFIELAAQEQDDQSAVNAWLDADDDRYQSSGRQYMSGYYFTLYPSQVNAERHPFYGASRLEALAAAATFCRAELAK